MSGLDAATPQGDEGEAMKTSTYKIPKVDYREIKAMAARNDLTMQSVVNEALQEYCKNRGVILPSLR